MQPTHARKGSFYPRQRRENVAKLPDIAKGGEERLYQMTARRRLRARYLKDASVIGHECREHRTQKEGSAYTRGSIRFTVDLWVWGFVSFVVIHFPRRRGSCMRD